MNKLFQQLKNIEYEFNNKCQYIENNLKDKDEDYIKLFILTIWFWLIKEVQKHERSIFEPFVDKLLQALKQLDNKLNISDVKETLWYKYKNVYKLPDTRPITKKLNEFGMIVEIDKNSYEFFKLNREFILSKL